MSVCLWRIGRCTSTERSRRSANVCQATKESLPLGFRSVKISRVCYMSQNKSVVFVQAGVAPASAAAVAKKKKVNLT